MKPTQGYPDWLSKLNELNDEPWTVPKKADIPSKSNKSPIVVQQEKLNKKSDRKSENSEMKQKNSKRSRSREREKKETVRSRISPPKHEERICHLCSFRFLPADSDDFVQGHLSSCSQFTSVPSARPWPDAPAPRITAVTYFFEQPVTGFPFPFYSMPPHPPFNST